jgi:TonB family protein
VRSKKRVKRNSFKPTTLVAPFEVPEKIEEQDIEDFGEIEGHIDGIEGGVSRDEGGVKGGVLGAPPGKGYNISNAIYVTRVQKPKLIKKVNPVYPKIAKEAGIKGRVIVEATTDVYGRVSIVKVINGHPLLNNAAITAIKQWIYEPYIVNGKPKPVKFIVYVTFNLIR